MEKTIYELLGEKNLKKLVDEFYELVKRHPAIKDLFQNDFEEIKEKQFFFLTQFFGGPPLYAEKYGHPMMRKRHLPHKITQEAKEAWLDCMRQAVEKLPIDKRFKFTLYNCFPKLAEHMVNS
jgi:hemoglobin